MSDKNEPDDLESLRLPAGIKAKISEVYSTVSSVAHASAQELVERAGIPLRTAKTAISSARRLMNLGPITALDMLEIYKNKRKLTTGSQKFDEILGGGISTGAITEIIGEYASGKTQLAFQLCINVQLPYELGGLEGNAYFIDTEGTFSAKRIFEIAHNKKQLFQDIPDPETILENIHVGRAYNAEHQIGLIKEAEKIISQNKVRLLIIDSVAAHFRAEYIGKDSLAPRAQALMSHAALLTRLADTYDLVILVTNQVMASIDKFVGATATEPALGFAWGHRPQTRIFLRKQRGTARIARIIDSPELPELETVFFITERGVEDGMPREDHEI